MISNYGLNAHGVPLYRPSGPRCAPDSFAGHTAGEFLGYVGTWQLRWRLAALIAGFVVKTPTWAWLA